MAAIGRMLPGAVQKPVRYQAFHCFWACADPSPYVLVGLPGERLLECLDAHFRVLAHVHPETDRGQSRRLLADARCLIIPLSSVSEGNVLFGRGMSLVFERTNTECRRRPAQNGSG